MDWLSPKLCAGNSTVLMTGDELNSFHFHVRWMAPLSVYICGEGKCQPTGSVLLLAALL